MKITATALLFLAVGLVLPAGSAIAASLDSNTCLNAATQTGISLQGGTQIVATNASGVYDFGDTNGDGTRIDAVIPSGLSLGSFRLYTDDAGSGYGNSTGPNATSIKLRLAGGALTGNSGVTNLLTWKVKPYTWGMGSIQVVDVGAISLGIIDTHIGPDSGTTAAAAEGSNVTLGEPIGTGSGPAGDIRIDTIDAYSISAMDAGSIAIYGSGNVLIQTPGGVKGKLDSHTAGIATMNILVKHNGAFAADQVLTYYSTHGSRGVSAGSITLNGDAPADGASGELAASILDASVKDQGADFTGPGGAVTVSGYTGVTITSNLLTYAAYSGYAGGDVTITNIAGNILVPARIDLHSYNPATARSGNLTLAATGTITVNDLNLTNINIAAFNAGGTSYIQGLITGTNGLPASGLGSIGTRLRAPAGKTIFYVPKKNPDLGGRKLTLADPSGTAGAGGNLAPPPSGTVVWFK